MSAPHPANRLLATTLLTFVTVLSSGLANADAIRVDNAWARATAPGQKVAAVFMDLTAGADRTLVAAESPASKQVELHTMAMENGVMIMREVKEIALPKGRTVQLKPGGLHIMLIDLNGQITADSSVALTLVVKDAAGRTERLAVRAPAKAMGGHAPRH